MIPLTTIHIQEDEHGATVGKYKFTEYWKKRLPYRLVRNLESYNIDLSDENNKDLVLYKAFHASEETRHLYRRHYSIAEYFKLNNDNPRLKQFITSEKELVNTLLGYGYDVDNSYFYTDLTIEKGKFKSIQYYVYDLTQLSAEAREELAQFLD